MQRLIAGAASAALVVAVTSGPGPALAAFRPPAHQLVCESTGFRRQECPADTRGGVRLLQQTSGLCTRGSTWGSTPRGLWVTNGCRAIFAVTPGSGGGAPPTGRLIVCESTVLRPHHCAAHLTRRPRIEVITGTCREGRTWRWDRRGITVSGGCRARFLIV